MIIIPIGGFIMMDNSGTKSAAVRNMVIGLVNLLFAGLLLFFSFYYIFLGRFFLMAVGLIFAVMGLLMIVLNFIGFLRVGKKNQKNL